MEGDAQKALSQIGNGQFIVIEASFPRLSSCRSVPDMDPISEGMSKSQHGLQSMAIVVVISSMLAAAEQPELQVGARELRCLG